MSAEKIEIVSKKKAAEPKSDEQTLEVSENDTKSFYSEFIHPVDENGIATIKLSNRHTVKIKELNGSESMKVQRLIPSDANADYVLMCKATASIREMNGIPYGILREQVELDNLSGKFSDKEFTLLQNSYLYTFAITDEQRSALKNLLQVQK